MDTRHQGSGYPRGMSCLRTSRSVGPRVTVWLRFEGTRKEVSRDGVGLALLKTNIDSAFEL